MTENNGKPVYKINLRQDQQTIIDSMIGFQLILLFSAFGLAGLAAIVYRLDNIKSALGL